MRNVVFFKLFPQTSAISVTIAPEIFKSCEDEQNSKFIRPL